MDKILLDHGSGGRASGELVRDLFLKYLQSPVLARLEDSAVLGAVTGRLTLTTDSYVVDPLFFPGGNIGELAINGTINDLAMLGAAPLALSLALILEEGFGLAELERIIAAIGAAADTAGVPVVTGDTKVVPRGKADKIFITTSGVGLVAPGVEINPTRICAGDLILLSGSLADHGITILTSRAGLAVSAELRSDTMALHRLVAGMIRDYPGQLHAMRDPTRGGVAASLTEMASVSGLCLEIDESSLPIRPVVRASCELLGLDPLYLANEGKCVVIAAPEAAAGLLAFMRSQPEGREAAIIGRVTAQYPRQVVLKTAVGGLRLVEPLSGEPLPRIC